jgi:hypothetical protein
MLGTRFRVERGRERELLFSFFSNEEHTESRHSFYQGVTERERERDRQKERKIKDMQSQNYVFYAEGRFNYN